MALELGSHNSSMPLDFSSQRENSRSPELNVADSAPGSPQATEEVAAPSGSSAFTVVTPKGRNPGEQSEFYNYNLSNI